MENVIEHKIKLVHANRSDFMELKSINPHNHKKIFKLRFGVPFWLKNKKGEIEHNNYITEEDTDLNDLKVYFREKRIFTLKNRWHE